MAFWLDFAKLFLKIVRGILGHIVYFVSFLTPRDSRKYLCGCYTGFMDNSKYLYLQMLERGINTLWYTERKSDAEYVKKLGLPVAYKYSLKGLYHCLTAGNYVSTHFFKDYSRWTSGNVRTIVLWHGLPIKSMEIDKSPLPILKKIYNSIISPSKGIDVLLSTSDLVTEHFLKCFFITTDNIVYYSYPRCDFMMMDQQSIMNHLLKIYDLNAINLITKIRNHSKVYLYMPTWRDSGEDFFKQAGFDYCRLNDVLRKRNELFLLKIHPNTKIDIQGIENLSNILLLEKSMDLYPILSYVDCLITDFSSIYLDFILFPQKEVILFLFDFDDYINKCRNLIMDYDKAVSGKKVYSFEELLDVIQNNAECPVLNRNAIVELYWNRANRPFIEYVLGESD